MGLYKGRIEIMEDTRAMLHDQDIPMHLWAEATRIAVYVQNHTPHKVLENKTPEEVFSCKKLEYSVVLCTYTFQKRRGQNYILQEIRVYLWDTLKARRLTEYTSQDSRRSTSTRM